MYEFFKRNNKKLMAVFGVILMVAFLMPTFPTGGPAMGNPRVGTLNGNQVLKSQVDQADEEWRTLAQRVVVQGQMGQGQWQSILGVGFVPEQLSRAVSGDPTIYFLLQQEAREMGMVPQFDEADRILENPQVALVNLDKRILPAADADPRVRAAARTSIANLLMVLNGYQRAMSVVKVSEPLLKHEIALRLQQIKVRLADFMGKDYLDKVPTPTTEQLQKHFDQFAKIEAGGPESETNPFAFGYKYPNRVKLQYLSIPRDEVRRAVKATRSDYDWEVEERRYFMSHQSAFPSTAPAATQESFSLMPVAPRPTTRPFEEVRGDIHSRIIEPLTDRLALQVQSDITSRLTQDYHAYQTSRGTTTAPATAPAGVPFESFEYLQKLAADIQARHKVTLTIGSVADGFKTAEQLKELKDISKVPQFAELAVAAVEPFVAQDMRNQPVVLSLFEPSRTMTDDDRNTFIYRITAADQSHAPTSLDEIRPKVEEDWKRAAAFDLAKQDAQKLLEAARGPGLDVAAADKMKYVGPYSANAFTAIPDYKLSTRAQSTFVRDTYKLLSAVGKPDGSRPITLVPMPADEKVAVAELVQIESGLTPQTAGFAQSLFSGQILQQYASALAEGWFDHASILERVNYKDLTRAEATP